MAMRGHCGGADLAVSRLRVAAQRLVPVDAQLPPMSECRDLSLGWSHGFFRGTTGSVGAKVFR